MSKLLISPNSKGSKIHNITPENANWFYVGFDVYDLSEGEEITGGSKEREFCIVLLSGSAFFSTSKKNFGL